MRVRLRVLSIRDNEVTDLAPLRDLMTDQLLVSRNPIDDPERLEIGLRIAGPERFGLTKLRWETEDGALYQIEESQDLESWVPTSHWLRGDGRIETYPVLARRPGFFRVIKR